MMFSVRQKAHLLQVMRVQEGGGRTTQSFVYIIQVVSLTYRGKITISSKKHVILKKKLLYACKSAYPQLELLY